MLLQLGSVVVKSLVEHPEHEAPVERHPGGEERHEDDQPDPAADAAAAKLFGLGVPAENVSVVKVIILLLHLKWFTLMLYL